MIVVILKRNARNIPTRKILPTNNINDIINNNNNNNSNIYTFSYYKVSVNSQFYISSDMRNTQLNFK